MPDGTVRGGFELNTQGAVRGLNNIRDAGRDVDRTMREVGLKLDQLSAKMDRFGQKRVRATVELAGWDRVNAQLSELEARLDRLDRKSVSSRVAIGGGFGNLAGGSAASAGGRGGGGGIPGLGGRFGGPLAIGTAVALAPQLLGGVGALGASAGSAALGAGVVGLGGASSLAAGGALSYMSIKPAVTALQEVTKAQDKYTEAVQQFGRASAQAAAAKRAYDATLVENPAAAGAARQFAATRTAFQTATAGGRAQFYRGASGVLYNARQALPTLGRYSTAATGAVANAAINYTGFLGNRQNLATTGILTSSFVANLPTVERSLQNITTTMGNLSVAATPFFHEANVWVQHWTAGMARSSSDTARVRNTMQGLVTSAKDWARLTGAAGRTLRDLFAPGVRPGNSMVVDFTNTLNRWDTWLRRNPDKVRKFFDDGVRGTEKIATTIGNLARDVWQIVRAASPFLNRAEDFIRFASGVGGGSLLTGAGLLYAGYGGARRALGGGGPSAGGALGSFILGSPGGLMRGRGGGGALGAVGAAETTGAAIAGARMSSFSRPLTGAQAAMDERSALLLAGLGGGRRSIPIEGAPREIPIRPGGPVSQLGPVPMAELSGAAGVIGKAGRAVAGFARAAAPVVAILSAVQGVAAGAGAGGGVGHRVNVGVSTALSGLTLGTVPATSLEHVFHAAFGTTPAGASLGLAGTGALARQANRVRTPAQLRAVQRTVAGSVGGFEMSSADAARLQAFNTRVLSVAARNAGAASSNTWQNAFATNLAHGGRPAHAVDLMLRGMGHEITALGPAGGRAFAEDTAKWASQLEQENPRLRRPLQRMMGGIVKDLNRLSHTTGTTMQDLRNKIFYFNGQILSGSQTTWQKIGQALTDPAQVAQERLLGIFGQIQQEAVNALTSMGFSRAQARQIVTQESKGGRGAKNANLAVATAQAGLGHFSPVQSNAPAGLSRRKHARGGMIGGSGLLDTIPTPDGGMAAPGEAWIANRHTMRSLDSAALAKYGKTAWQMIRDENRPHSAPMHRLGDVVSQTHPELHTGIAAAVSQVLSRFPQLAITSTTGGRHAPGSYHYKGEAADLASDRATMYAASQWILSSGLAPGLTEGIHNPNLAVKNGQIQRPPGVFGGVWAGHLNHIHLAVAGALNAATAGGGGAIGGVPSAIALHGIASGLGGVPGALANAGSSMYAAGLQRKINDAIGATGISAAGFTGGGTSGANQALGRRMMLAAGWGADQWPALRALWTQESGWNANAVNPSSGAAGIPQALGHGHPFNLGDAPAQIAWGLNYIRGRYGSPSAAEAHERAFNWYGRGGHAQWGGWNERGGSWITNGATLFGAGEKGKRERVSITPAGSRGAGGHTIIVRMENVHLSAQPHEIDNIGREVAAKILAAIDRVGQGVSDAELMAGAS